MGTREPNEIVDTAEPALLELADERATQDAADHMPPGVPSPTRGEAAIAMKGHAIEAELAAAQHRETTSNRATRAHNQQVLDAHGRGEEVVVPDTVPQHKIFPLELLGVLAMGVIETWALEGPVGTSLDLPQTGLERTFIPAIVALVTAVLAHMSAAHWRNAHRSRVPAVQDAERSTAAKYAAAVFVVSAIGVIARYWGAQVMSQLADPGTTVAPEGLAFFITFQLGFAFGSLALARSYRARLGAALDNRLRVYLDGLAASNLHLDQNLADISTRHAFERAQVATAAQAASVRYRNSLSEQHPDVDAQLAWAARTARDVAAGSLGHVRGAARADAPEQTQGVGEDAASVERDVAEPTQAPPAAPAAEAVDLVEDEDLFDAIVNPPQRR